MYPIARLGASNNASSSLPRLPTLLGLCLSNVVATFGVMKKIQLDIWMHSREGAHSMKVTTYAPPFRLPYFRSLENLYSFNPYFWAKNEENVVLWPLLLSKFGTDLRPKNGQTRGYSGVGRHGRMFLPFYSPEGYKLLLNTRNNSGLLATEIDMLHDRFYSRQNGRGSCQFHWRVTQFAAGSSFGCKSLQVGRNSLDGITGQSQVGRRCIMAVGPWLWLWGPSLCR